MPDVLTVDEAAARAKLSPKTIYRALEAGHLTGSKVGTVWRIFETDLEQWLISLQPGRGATTSPRRRGPVRRPHGSLRALDDSMEGSTP